jgi:hypothetical protein
MMVNPLSLVAPLLVLQFSFFGWKAVKAAIRAGAPNLAAALPDLPECWSRINAVVMALIVAVCVVWPLATDGFPTFSRIVLAIAWVLVAVAVVTKVLGPWVALAMIAIAAIAAGWVGWPVISTWIEPLMGLLSPPYPLTAPVSAAT